MQDNASQEIPGLAAAEDNEQTRRQLAFSGTLLPIAGVWCQQFTPAHWVNLSLVRSPFMGGDRGNSRSVVSILEFLWIVSPSYRPGSFWRMLFFYARHYRKIKPATAAEIYDYLDAAFQDAPAGSGNKTASRSYYAGVASLCDFFAEEYGWQDGCTLGTPIARLFQYYNVARKRKDPQAILFNPSDRVRAQAQHLRNAENAR